MNDLSETALINTGVFLRTLIAPLMVWGVAVFVVTAAGQPGVVCITPMAWLLALWSGGQYIRQSAGRPGRWPLLGPALVGASLGLGMAVIFTVVSQLAMPVGNDPEELNKMRVLMAVIIVGGVITCTIFSIFTAWLTLRRFARAPRPQP